MTLSPKLVTLFIPIYSQHHAIAELARQIHAASAEWLDIRVVTNGSPPAVLAALERSGVPFLELTKNVGYGGAIQMAVATARTPYVAWIPGNLKISIADVEQKAWPLLSDGPTVLRAAKGLRTARSPSDLWNTRILSATQSILSRTILRDGGAPPTIVARDLVPLIVGGPRDYVYDHWVLWRLITNRIDVKRFPIRYVPHPSAPSTWNRGMSARFRMFVHLNREVLKW